MAPELKRVRSKPAEWWAAQPIGSSPPRQETLPSKKREHASGATVKLDKATQKKGKTAKRKNGEEEENGETEPVQPSRRGRSSAGEKELKEIGNTADTNPKRKPAKASKYTRSENEGDDGPPKASKRRKSSLIVQEDEEEEGDPLADDPVQQKGKQPALEKVQLSVKHDSIAKKGRSLNTEANVRAVNYKEAATRNPSSLNLEADASDPVEESTVSRKEKSKNVGGDKARPVKGNTRSKIPAPSAKIAEVPAKDSLSTRRGRSSNTEAELKAVNYKETATRKQNSGGETEAVSKKLASAPKGLSANEEEHESRVVKESKKVAKKPSRSKITSEGSSHENLPLRKGRSSNTEAEIRGVNYKETATRKQDRVDAVKESMADVVQKSKSKSEGEQRRGRSSNTESELRAQVNYKESKTVKRGVVPDAAVDRQSSQTTNSRSKSRKNVEEDGVEIASSNFSKSRSKSTVKPAIENKTSTSRNESRAKVQEKSQMNKTKGKAAAQSAVPQKSKKSKRLSENATKKRKPVVEDHGPEQPPPKRQRSDNAQEKDQPEIIPEYQHLATITRKVSRATIDSKWDGLPSSCVDRISELLQDIQRPVVVRLGDEQKRKQASTTLQVISRRLISKISRGLPFPPSIRNNREDDFNFEKIIDHNRALESQLTPALHANELLEAELAKEKEKLVAEVAYLDELEGNAKAEASKRKQNARNIHALLQPSGPRDTEDLDDESAFNTDDPMMSIAPNLLQDENLQAVVQDLQGHVDSIEGNLKQVHGITEAMTRSKAAVQATLYGRLDSLQYEDVVLG